MNYFKQVTTGLSMYPKAYRFISEKKLWGSALFPGAVSLILLLVILYFAFNFSDDISVWLLSWTNVQNAETTFGHIIAFIALWLIRFILITIFYVSYKVLMINFMAPLLYLFSNEVLNSMHGKKTEAPIQWDVFIKELFKGIVDAVRILVKELFIIGLISILALVIPIFSPFAPLIIIAVESYFIGISMVDHTAAYRGYTVEEGRNLRKRNKGLSMGVGLGFTVLFLVPLFGVLVAPSLGITSACLGVEKVENN
ncbi:EI24 domain-containing protein [Chondrinema litorale]|uniref:EI24 domain-containing protein n=1 Tax=Chondrinema litorale TaxID=2994555 RepID=UPI0025435435|nr:EI24 domain-containing protein [Chondrinema litorale]UZR92269.1 EI24 domain-containing protein [Chondrinema litorale]